MDELRRTSIVFRIFRGAWLAIACVVAFVFLYQAGVMLGDPTSPIHRVDTGAHVHVEPCADPTTGLEPCPEAAPAPIVPDSPQVAVDAHADAIAIRVAAALLAIFCGAVAFARRPSRIAEGLEERAPGRTRALRAAWALLAIPPIAVAASFALHEWWPLSARPGFAFGVSVLALWALFALERRRHSRRTLAALSPVLTTPRSRIGEAIGTVELSVQAHTRGGGVPAVIGGDVVAYSEVRVAPRRGPRSWIVKASSDALDVADESGAGELHLGEDAIIDTEVRRLTLKVLPPRYAERGIVAPPDPKRRGYVVEERVIRDGERLYVFGDVNTPFADQGAYRSVSGATTLGGEGVPPVLVYAGSERGLVAALFREARQAKSIAAAAAYATAALGAALAYLSWL